MTTMTDQAARKRIDAAKATIMEAIGRAGFENLMAGGEPSEIITALLEVLNRTTEAFEG